MFVQLIVIFAVLVVSSARHYHAQVQEVAKVAVLDSELGAKLVKLLDEQRAAERMNFSAHSLENKDDEGERKVSKSKEALTSTVALIDDGFFVQSSKANSDCSGVSTHVQALKLNTCNNGRKYLCSTDGDVVNRVIKVYSDKVNCFGTSYQYQITTPLSKCGFDQDSYAYSKGVRKLRTRCVPTADMPVTPGLAVAVFTDSACTNLVENFTWPYGDCEMVIDTATNSFHYLQLTGMTSDHKRMWKVYHDAACVRLEGSYSDSGQIDVTSCTVVGGGGYVKNVIIPASAP